MAKVYLVGAGCGDVDLITVKGKRVIQQADVIIYDYLANPALLADSKKNCEHIYVGKQAGNHAMVQEDINQLLVKKAVGETCVVRLKGGDPYVFGRGGEEAIVLKQANIPFEIVPGITSAIGGLAYAGIPVTSRGEATSFHVITGHRKQGSDALDFSVYAKLKGTLVFLMGMSNLTLICTELICHGLDKNTPAAVVHRASTPYQKTVVGTLSTIVDEVKRQRISAPALIVVGEVVNKHEQLNFFEKKPLFSKRIVVTRSRAQSSTMMRQIHELGGLPIEMPMFEVVKQNESELQLTIKEIQNYQYMIFTSVNGVKVFFDTLSSMQLDARTLGNTKIVAIGTGTQKALKQNGIIADFVPKEFVSEAVVEMLKDVIVPSDKVLIPRASIARPYLVEELSTMATVTEIKTYETKKVDHDYSKEIDQLTEGNVDYVTFTSSSTVTNFIETLGSEYRKILADTKLVSIGPITSKTIESYGLAVYKEAETYTIDGMIEVLKNDEQ